MPAPRPTRRREWLLWPVAAVIVATVVLEAATGTTPLLGRAFNVLSAVVFITAGATLLVHRPDNAVSWIVALPSLYFLGNALGNLVAPVASAAALLWVAWAQQVLFAPTVLPLAALLPLLFPTGHPPSRRWRWPLGLGVVGVVLFTVGNGLAPNLLHDLGMDRLPPQAANPVGVLPRAATDGILAVGAATFVAAFVAGVVSIVVRTRRASGVERQQLRWFARAASLALVAFLVSASLEAFGREDVGGWVLGLGLLLLPVAVAVAILRYRLYDLDRLVSRTIGWTVVSGVLLLVYVALILGSRPLLSGREVPDLVVAGSTLAVAALIRPVHRRVQGAVDRRFNRARLDAQQTVDAFVARLRGDLDLTDVADHLRTTVTATLAPVTVSVWTVPVDPHPVQSATTSVSRPVSTS